MSHPDESDFYSSVRAWLLSEFDPKSLEHDKYMHATGRYPDFIVEMSHEIIAVEVDVTLERAIKGVGQAHLYAGELLEIDAAPTVRPAVVLPASEVEQPELEYLRTQIPVYPIPHPYPPSTTTD